MVKTRVFITVDTEHSIGGAFQDPTFKPVGNDLRIFGKIQGREFGIPMIMDIADEFGLPVVFFLEVLNYHYFGKDETRKVCEYILGRGHDVQLHLHPNYLNFKEPLPGLLKYRDNMAFYSSEDQYRLISEGRSLLMEYGVSNPVAFRAGNFGADHNTLQALAENDFKFDSSYNLAYPYTMQDIKKDCVINDLTAMGSILELPVTCFEENIPCIRRRIKPLDINGAGFGEIREILEYCNKKHFSCVTIILHSFSFYQARDPQYHSVRIIHPVIKRFRKLCHYLSRQNDQFDVVCFKSCPKFYSQVPQEEEKHHIPNASICNSFIRYAEQAACYI